MNTAERYTQVIKSLKSELGSSERDLLTEALKLRDELTKIQVTSDEALGQSNYFHGLLIGLGAGIAKQLSNPETFTDREFLQNIYRFIKDETREK
jgi:hypothetical protein